MSIQRSKYGKYFAGGAFTLVMFFLLLLIFYGVKNGQQVISIVGSGVATFLDVISPIIYGFALAYILYRPVRYLEQKLIAFFSRGKKELSNAKLLLIRVSSILFVFATVIFVFVLLFHFLVPPIIENVEKLIHSNSVAAEGIEPGLSVVKSWLDKYADTLAIMGEGQLTSAIAKVVMEIVGNIGPMVIDTIATIILTFYFLKDKENLFRAINRFGDVIFSPRVKKYVMMVLRDIDEIIGGFVIGTIFAGIIVGIISTILMLLIGHPFALLIGVVAGLANVIPYVGPLIGAALALVLGLLDSVNLGLTGCVLLLIYQQIDGNFIEPKIVGDKIGLPAVWILMAVIIGGSYFGGIGMILSAPLAALAKVYIDRAYEYKQKKWGNSN